MRPGCKVDRVLRLVLFWLLRDSAAELQGLARRRRRSQEIWCARHRRERVTAHDASIRGRQQMRQQLDRAKQEARWRFPDTPRSITSRRRSLACSGNGLRQGAFTATIARHYVRALFNHNPDAVLGRMMARTLTLSEDAKSLRYTVQLNADDPIAASVAAKVKRRDVTGSSFWFSVGNPEDEE
jgi:HK97 family phage prohead protease